MKRIFVKASSNSSRLPAGYTLRSDSWFEKYGFDMDPQFKRKDEDALADMGIQFVGYASDDRIDYNDPDGDLDTMIMVVGRDADGSLHVYCWSRGELCFWE